MADRDPYVTAYRNSLCCDECGAVMGCDCWEKQQMRLMVCEECGCRVQVVAGKYAAHGIRHPEDSPYCEASGTEPD